MKKVLCVVAVLVMALCLTGCSSGKVKLSGDWYALELSGYDELLAKRPTALSDLPEELQYVSSSATVTFREVSKQLSVIEIDDRSNSKLLFAHKLDSGEWKLYEETTYWKLLRFEKDDKGREFSRGNMNNDHGMEYDLTDSNLYIYFIYTGSGYTGPIEKWADDAAFWLCRDNRGLYSVLLVRRDSLLDDALKLK